MTVIQIDVGLRLRQTFENEFAAELGADPLQIGAPGRLARAYGMAERTLSLAEEDLLTNRGHVRRRLDGRDIEFFFGGRQRCHLGNGQGHQREESQHDGYESDDPGKLSPDEQQNDDAHPDDRQTDQLQHDDFTHRDPELVVYDPITLMTAGPCDAEPRRPWPACRVAIPLWARRA